MIETLKPPKGYSEQAIRAVDSTFVDISTDTDGSRDRGVIVGVPTNEEKNLFRENGVVYKGDVVGPEIDADVKPGVEKMARVAMLSAAGRKGGDIDSRIKYLDAETGGLNALKVEVDTTVTPSAQASEADRISETTRPTLEAVVTKE